MPVKRPDRIISLGSQILIILVALFFFLLAPAMAKLPNAIVNTPEELKKVETEPESQSADDLSRELSNPNTPLAKLTIENTTTFYDGDLPGSDDQVVNLTLFQPIFPFPLVEDGTTNLFARPAFTFITGQPAYDPVEETFNDSSGLGDMGFDVALGQTTPSGWIFVGGLQGTVPIASESELSCGQFRLGPEFAAVYMSKMGFLGAFPQHQWDVGGWKNSAYATTNIEIFAGLYLEKGWTLISNPVISYDWQGEQWTVPLNLTVKKVMRVGSLPVQVSAGLDYYIKANDDFGPDWAVVFSFTPIVPNFIYSWLTK